MTPLAHAIAVEMTKPVKDRLVHDPDSLAAKITDFHCFECSEIISLARELAQQDCVPAGGNLAFLPADMTWLEFRDLSWLPGAPALVAGAALALRQVGDHAEVYSCIRTKAALFAGNMHLIGRIPLKGAPDLGSSVEVYHSADLPAPSPLAGLAPVIYALLALINSPRVVGRVTRLPHAGLQRRLAAAKGIAGKFPLNATTEMRLHVGEAVIEDDVERTAWLSGERALHYCRAHLRIVGGVVVHIGRKRIVLGGKGVQVVGHWRGNAANGMRRTRYKMLPPRPGREA